MKQIQTREKCPACNGEGTTDPTKINACLKCLGSGYIYEWVNIEDIFKNTPNNLSHHIRVLEHMSYYTVEKFGMSGWVKVGLINK